jgi:hypothetical protein
MDEFIKTALDNNEQPTDGILFKHISSEVEKNKIKKLLLANKHVTSFVDLVVRFPKVNFHIWKKTIGIGRGNIVRWSCAKCDEEHCIALSSAGRLTSIDCKAGLPKKCFTIDPSKKEHEEVENGEVDSGSDDEDNGDEEDKDSGDDYKGEESGLNSAVDARGSHDEPIVKRSKRHAVNDEASSTKKSKIDDASSVNGDHYQNLLEAIKTYDGENQKRIATLETENKNLKKKLATAEAGNPVLKAELVALKTKLVDVEKAALATTHAYETGHVLLEKKTKENKDLTRERAEALDKVAKYAAFVKQMGSINSGTPPGTPPGAK